MSPFTGGATGFPSTTEPSEAASGIVCLALSSVNPYLDGNCPDAAAAAAAACEAALVVSAAARSSATRRSSNNTPVGYVKNITCHALRILRYRTSVKSHEQNTISVFQPFRHSESTASMNKSLT